MVSNKGNGFTLVELMLALAIVAIGVALALPEFRQWNARMQLRDAASEIANQLVLSRMAAMNRNRSVDVTVDTVAGAVTISAVSLGSAVIAPKTMMAQVKTVIGGPVTVTFSSLGVRTSGGTTNQTISVCNAFRQRYDVRIIPAGKVNWFSSNGGCP